MGGGLMAYTEFMIVCGFTQQGVTDNISDGIHYGVPIRFGELWEFNFWMLHRAGAPQAVVQGSWVQFDLDGKSMGVVPTGTYLLPDGGIKDDVNWVHYEFQHIVGDDSDGYADPGDAGVVGYIIPAIWWKSTSATPLAARYLQGLMLAKINTLGGRIEPVTPDVFLTLGVTGQIPPDTHDLLGSDKSRLAPE